MSPTATPFDFSRLQKMSAAELKLWQGLYRFAGSADLVAQFLPQLEKTLQETLREDCSIRFQGMRLEGVAAWQRHLAKEGIYALVSAGPASEKGFLLLDSVFALSLIDHLLGGELKELPHARALSEIEEGALSYLLARLLQALFDFAGGEPGHFRLERIFGGPDSLQPFLEGVETVALVDLRIALSSVAAVIQLALPDTFIGKELVQPLVGTSSTATDTECAARLENFGDLDYPLVASIGETRLTEQEVLSLEAGDILLVDQPHARFKEGHFEGEVMLLPRQGAGPKLRATIQQNAEATLPRLEVEAIYRGA